MCDGGWECSRQTWWAMDEWWVLREVEVAWMGRWQISQVESGGGWDADFGFVSGSVFIIFGLGGSESLAESLVVVG